MNTRLLISVRNLAEGRIALDGGADLIDLKEPHAGALGAVSLETARSVVSDVARRRITSATVGDLPARASILEDAARRMSMSGVDYVKIGFLPSPADDVSEAIAELAPVAREVSMIAVFFAERLPVGDLVAATASAGFSGIMLDTADKSGGSLRDHLSDSDLRKFVGNARQRGLIVGLAGSLSAEDVSPLAVLGPDYLGFRGAACLKHQRNATLDLQRVSLIRTLLDAANGSESSTAGLLEQV